jgi:hypothetical protein
VRSPAVFVVLFALLLAAAAAPPSTPSVEAGAPSASHRPSSPPTAAPTSLAVLAGLVARLEADPTSDWRRVDLEAVRRHLADLERVTLAAEVRAEELPGGVGLTVTGPDPASVAAIRRLLPERAARLAEARRWKVATVTVAEGLRVEVRSLDPREAGRIRALGLTGLLVVGPLDEAYLLSLARGEPPPGRPGR